MSHIPKTPKMMQPVSKISCAQASTPGHDNLFRLVWENIDSMVAEKFSELRRKVISDVPQQIENHSEETASIILALKRNLNEPKLKPDTRKFIEHYLPLCVEYAQIVPPPFNDQAEALVILVENFILQKSIEEIKGRRGEERKEQIGFIDFECTIKVPARSCIENGIPYLVKSFRSEHNSIFEHAFDHQYPVVSDRDQLQAPQWRIYDEYHTIWIDIRPELPAVGQLLRELKVLRSHSPTNSSIWVIADSVDSQLAMMLKAEGFLISDRSWIEALSKQR